MLTPKQEKFCQGVAKGLTYSDAYREAYNASKMKAETVNRRAAELMSYGKIKARVEELKEKTTGDIKYTIEDSFNNLRKAQELALSRKNPLGEANPDLTNFIKAEELMGKLKGLYVEKREISGGLDISPFEIKIIK